MRSLFFCFPYDIFSSNFSEPIDLQRDLSEVESETFFWKKDRAFEFKFALKNS